MGLPEIGYLRLPQIIGDKTANPPIPPLLPISRSTFLNGVRDGRFPQGILLSPRTRAWRVEDIRMLIENLGRS